MTFSLLSIMNHSSDYMMHCCCCARCSSLSFKVLLYIAAVLVVLHGSIGQDNTLYAQFTAPPPLLEIILVVNM